MSITKLAIAFTAVAALAGCATAPNATMSENPGTFDVNRTAIQGQAVECTIRTNERGTTRGGVTVFEDGTASRTCVSNPRAAVRNQSGINQDLRDLNGTLNQIGQGVNSVNRVMKSLERLGR